MLGGVCAAALRVTTDVCRDKDIPTPSRHDGAAPRIQTVCRRSGRRQRQKTCFGRQGQSSAPLPAGSETKGAYVTHGVGAEAAYLRVSCEDASWLLLHRGT